MKTITAIHAYEQRIKEQEGAIQQLKSELGDAQRAHDVSRTQAEYFQKKYEELMNKFLPIQAEHAMMKNELGRAAR